MLFKKFEKNEMSGRVNLDLVGDGSPLMELFDACKNGDLQKVKRFLVNSQQRDFVNSRDKEGRKSTCLHFAAGKF